MEDVVFQKLLVSITNHQTRSLAIQNSTLTTVQFNQLSAAISANQSVESLFFGYGDLSDSSVDALTTALKQHPTLTALKIQHIQLSDHGIKAIADLLEVNTTITELCLNHCGLTDQNVMPIAKALSANMTLQKLVLTDNTISAAIDDEFAKALSVNTSLTEICLPGLQIHKSRQQLFLNQTLQTLLLQENNITIKLRNTVLQYLQQKLAAYPSLENMILKKIVSVETPSLRAFAMNKTVDLLLNRVLIKTKMKECMPEELFEPIARDYFRQKSQTHGEGVSLFNPLGALNRAAQRQEGVPSDCLTFKLMPK